MLPFIINEAHQRGQAMTSNTGPTAKLCEWVCSTTYESIPAEVRKETITLLYDQVGGMIPSAILPSCKPVVDLVRKLGSGSDCSVIGHRLRASVTDAALANGTIGHGRRSRRYGSAGHRALCRDSRSARPDRRAVCRGVRQGAAQGARARLRGGGPLPEHRGTLRDAGTVRRERRRNPGRGSERAACCCASMRITSSTPWGSRHQARAASPARISKNCTRSSR